MKKTITFGEGKSFELFDRNAYCYQFNYSVVESSLIGMPEEEDKTEDFRLKVNISRELQLMWKLQSDDEKKVCFEYGKRHVIEKLKDGTLSEFEEIWLMTTNVPVPCEFNPKRIIEPDETTIEVEIEENIGEIIESAIKPDAVAKKSQRMPKIELSSSIIERRSNINILFRNKYKESLFHLVDERDLLQLFRSASTSEEFTYRISSLKNLCTELNMNLLRQIISMDNNSIESINLLEKYILSLNYRNNSCIQVFRKINRLRQAYPIHGDNVDGVMDAYRFFSFEYPIPDYNDAWNTLLMKYNESLKELLEIVKTDIFPE